MMPSEIEMRVWIVALAMVVSGAAWAAPKLPLQEGEYSPHPCGSALASEPNGSLGIYSTGGGGTFITPNSEGIDAYCSIVRLSKRGADISGRAKCASGGMKVKNEIGTYTFAYRIKSPTSFTTNGSLYTWCAPHK